MSLASERTQMDTEILNIISGGMAEPRCVIVGCGGASARIVGRMGEHIRGVPRVIINTDMAGLQHVDADRKICIGNSITFKGDSGGFPEVAEKCAELASDDIMSCLISKEVAFIVAGYGGGTGTALAPMVARMAKGLGMVTFGICILPFSAESSRRQMAQDNFKILQGVADSAVALDNDRLLKLGGDITLEQAFCKMDMMVADLIKSAINSMSRDFVATLADEILAYQREMEMHSHGSVGLGEPEMVAYADGGITPLAFPQQSDRNLIDMGGLFQRT